MVLPLVLLLKFERIENERADSSTLSRWRRKECDRIHLFRHGIGFSSVHSSTPQYLRGFSRRNFLKARTNFVLCLRIKCPCFGERISSELNFIIRVFLFLEIPAIIHAGKFAQFFTTVYKVFDFSICHGVPYLVSQLEYPPPPCIIRPTGRPYYYSSCSAFIRACNRPTNRAAL